MSNKSGNGLNDERKIKTSVINYINVHIYRSLLSPEIVELVNLAIVCSSYKHFQLRFLLFYCKLKVLVFKINSYSGYQTYKMIYLKQLYFIFINKFILKEVGVKYRTQYKMLYFTKGFIKAS